LLKRSLSGRIALLVLGLLFLVAGGLSWMSYRVVQRQTAATFRERIASLATRFAEAGATAPRETMARLTRLASDPAVIAALAPGATIAQQSNARDVLQASLPADKRSVLALLDTAGSRRLEIGPLGEPSWLGPPAGARPATRRTGPYGRLNDSTLYTDSRVPVRRGDTTVGVIVQRSRATLSRSAASAIADVLGAQIRYVAGDPGAGIWTDLTQFIDAPPIEAQEADSVSRFDWNGTRFYGIAYRSPGSPLVSILHAPQSAVMAPADAYLRRAILLVALALSLGGVGAFLLGRWIGHPIESIAHGAERLARGEPWTRADEEAPGEVGQLARAFNLMVEQVRRTTGHLIESEERYRLLAENARDIVSLRNGEGETLYLSPSGSVLLGYSNDELVTTPLEQLVHPDDVGPMRRARADVTSAGGTGVATATYRVRRGDGQWIWIETLYRRMPATAGAAPGILSSSRDITERKELEGQVLQSQKLEAIGRLAGGVAHDFNNLLTAIVGGVEAVGETLPPEHPAHLYLGEVNFASERAAALTRQLLTFSRRQVVQPTLLDLNLVLVDLDRLLRRIIGEDIELVTRITDGLPMVRADQGQIGQVVLNLAVNARDAMSRGGRMTIETRPVELDEEYAKVHPGVVPGPYVLLAVSDTGTGIPPEVAAHLFEPFFTTKAVGRGTGLGLATCFGIVAEAGGHIWYYTEQGAGTTFKVYLPQAPAAADVTARAKPEGEPGGTETILLVEDEEAVRIPAVRMLRAMGYTVLHADNGAVGLAMMTDGAAETDLIVTDLIMPQMGGMEMMQRLHATRPDLPVLFLSGYTEDALSESGSIIPDVHFLQKPFTRGELARAVRKALDD
jgi:two-component system, cell cycle sensor histidine kinase and response regulator CckA